MAKHELVFVPTPGMGHLLSAVELAKLILRRDDRISILVLIIRLHIDYDAINSYIDSQSRDADPTRVTFIILPPLPSLPDLTSPNFFSTLVDLQKPLVKQAIGEGSNPVGFVLDFFCTNLIDVANEFGVPSYIFFTSGAGFLSLMFHCQLLADDGGVDIPTELGKPDTELVVSGFKNRVPQKVLPGVLLQKDGGADVILYHARRFRESKGILVNTFMELESYGVKSLLDQAKDKVIPEVYPVGPLLELDSESLGGSRKEDRDEIMRWLDEQPPSSVVFLCFGSMGSFDEEQVKEIANGLDRSGHRFLWSLRRPATGGNVAPPSEHETFEEALPEGFLDRTTHRGKVIGWAPQVEVLAHGAIGGFVSHCGWNSMLESLWFGVPIATWPMSAEQQLNAFQLVKEMGLAVEIRMDYRRDWRTKQGSFVIMAEEIENGVKKLMSMDEETRAKVREISDKGRKALQDGGASHYWMGRFIEDVLANVALN